jgi:hypothetical protein
MDAKTLEYMGTRVDEARRLGSLIKAAERQLDVLRGCVSYTMKIDYDNAWHATYVTDEQFYAMAVAAAESTLADLREQVEQL